MSKVKAKSKGKGARSPRSAPAKKPPKKRAPQSELSKPRKKQGTLPTMEEHMPKRVAALDTIADEYANATENRQRWSRSEVDLKGKMIQAMHTHKITEYETDDYVFALVVDKEKIKVKRKGGDDEDEG